MKKVIRLPRILKINSVKGYEVVCTFNNGEVRAIDFEKLFKEWKVSKSDPEYILFDKGEFKKVRLRNQTLSWKNAGIELVDVSGNKVMHPYELSPDIIYNNSSPVQKNKNRFFFGSIIKETRIKRGLSQQELATRSGTSKTYISRVENNLIEPELSTLYKIMEIGLGKKVKVQIG